MPELPEVETVVRYLRPVLTGKTIASLTAENGYEKVFYPQSQQEICSVVRGREIRQVSRRAKYILFRLENGWLTIHLRMTGRLLFRLTEEDKQAHLTARFRFTDKTQLFFKDYRKFGRIHFHTDYEKLETRLGPEPLSDAFSATWFYRALQNKKRSIKALLLDQSFLAGLGNIYVDEALWQARIHPGRPACDISRVKANRLRKTIREILARAIKHQGTTIINFYFGECKSGNFRDYLMVFGKQGQPCPRCGSEIRKIREAQRGTHICPRCQK